MAGQGVPPTAAAPTHQGCPRPRRALMLLRRKASPLSSLSLPLPERGRPAWAGQGQPAREQRAPATASSSSPQLWRGARPAALGLTGEGPRRRRSGRALQAPSSGRGKAPPCGACQPSPRRCGGSVPSPALVLAAGGGPSAAAYLAPRLLWGRLSLPARWAAPLAPLQAGPLRLATAPAHSSAFN